MRVDPRADRGSTGGKFQHGPQRFVRAIERHFNLPGETTDLLPQTQRRGVGQMRAADLDDFVPLRRFLLQNIAKAR
jgi:hypothetical protein